MQLHQSDFLSGASALFLSAALLPAAHAQQPANTDQVMPALTISAAAVRSAVTEGTGDYTVSAANTATRLDLSLRETPQSISVVTRAMLDDFSLTSVSDMLAMVTGVNVEQVEPDRTYFSVRGFEVSNFLVDGIGLPFATGDQLGDLDTALYDRVEVLRGANGLLTATGNPSGTVNFVRKRPTAAFQASAGLTLGSWNNRRLDADVAGAVNQGGSMRARLVGAAQQKDSYLDRYSLKKTVFSGIVEADLAPDTLLTVGRAEQHNKPKGTMWGALPLYYSDGTPTNYATSAAMGTDWTYWNTDDEQTFVELAHTFASGWKSKATLLRRELTSDGKLLYVNGVPSRTDGTGLLSWPSRYNHSERQWGADVNASGSVDVAGRRHELVFGASWAISKNRLYSDDKDTNLALTEAALLAGSFPEPDFSDGALSDAKFTNRTRSLYGTARLNLADSVKVIVGANATKASSSGVQYSVPHDDDRSKVTPFVSALFDVDAQHTLYASYASIFSPQNQTAASGAVLEPIEGRNLEVGAKGAWMQQRLNGSVAVFRTRQDNTAEYAGYANGRSYYTGIDATTTGIEFDLAGQLTPSWDVSGGYTQFRLEDGGGADVRTYVPRKTLRLASNLRVPGVAGLKVGASLKWQDDIRRDQGGGVVTRQGAYALLDLVATYAVNRHVSVTAKLANVTDKKYLTSLLWAQSYAGAPINGSLTMNWMY